MSLNYLHDYYTRVTPNPRVLALCNAAERGRPYSSHCDPDLTVVINGYARPEYLPLIWEAVQYQSRRPRETWIVQNHPGDKSGVPRAFFEEARRHNTIVIDSGLNHGCWFRFLLAALQCRTRYLAVYDDDTLSGHLALETALEDLARKPGIYGARGITFKREPGGPKYWSYDVSGWPVGSADSVQVDFVGHLWVMETYWLKHLFAHLPEALLSSALPGRECGEDMYLSFVAQKLGIPTYSTRHGSQCNPRWTSIQAYEMGMHPNAMNVSGGLSHGDVYLQDYRARGWRLLRY